MGRIANTLNLARASLEVLKADKELIALPVISAIASLIVVLSFLVPLGFFRGFESVGGVEWVLMAVLYLVTSFITIFFNTALIHAANERLEGGDPTLGSAIAGAMSRLPQIAGWSLISATVSLILRQLEERAGLLGRIVISFVGMAWAVVTFLVIPVFVVEGIGVVDAVKRSGELFRRTWGENLIAQVGFGLLGFLVAIPFVIFAILAGTLGGPIGFVGMAIAVLGILGAVMVIAALNGVFQAALYHYAVSGEVPGGYFQEGDFRGAFRAR